MSRSSTSEELRSHLKDVLTWSTAHVDLEQALRNVPPALYGRRPDGLPYSLWQLLEHIRRAQDDILDYCLHADYAARSWPEDYWPEDPEPSSPQAWQSSVEACLRDRESLLRMIDDVDLAARLPHADEHTYLREVLVVADHTAYHVGQIVLLRRVLRIWPP